MTWIRTASTAAALLAVLMLTGCGGSSSGSNAGTSTGDAGRSAAGAVPGAAEAGTGADASGGKVAAPQSGAAASGSGSSSAADALVTEQKLVKTAAMSVQTRDVLAADAAVRTAVAQAKGFIADEKTSTTPPGPTPPGPTPPGPTPAVSGAPAVKVDPGYTQSVLTARVPNDSLDAVMASIAQTGTVVSRSQSTQDVTSQFVDTRSRVESQTASVLRVRALLTRANTLGEVVQIEGELARREADLESLEAQLKALQDQTTLSTLTVELSPVPAVVAPKKAHDTGFLAGLAAGWRALVGSLTVLLTVVGALLPFLVLVAMVGVPLLVWVRRLRAARGTSSRPVDPAQPQPAPAP
jgi:hypothetical protein